MCVCAHGWCVCMRSTYIQLINIYSDKYLWNLLFILMIELLNKHCIMCAVCIFGYGMSLCVHMWDCENGKYYDKSLNHLKENSSVFLFQLYVAIPCQFISRQTHKNSPFEDGRSSV